VGGWYDCGKLDTLLETNAILLAKGSSRRVEFPGVTIHDPVYIGDGAKIERSVIGPNVSLEKGTRISNSRISNSIIGADSVLSDTELDQSMIGDSVVVEGLRGSVTLGDHSEIKAKRSS
jgi:glucose-1-phosphate thymidylyltransferase